MPTSRTLKIKREAVGDSTPGRTEAVLVYRFRTDKKRKKKGSRGLRLIEKLVRRTAKANEAAASEYLFRHERSNRKRRDGWVRDFPVNSYRATQKAGKRLKLERVFF